METISLWSLTLKERGSAGGVGVCFFGPQSLLAVYGQAVFIGQLQGEEGTCVFCSLVTWVIL